MITIRTTKRQNAKERRMERRRWQHKGEIRFIARRVSYLTAIREVRESRALRPDCRFIYVQSANGDGYNALELL